MSMVPFMPADVGRQIQCGAGLGIITGYTSASTVTVTIQQQWPSLVNDAYSWTILGSPYTSCTISAVGPIGTAVTATLVSAGWRVEDVGKYIDINGGLVRITGYTDSTHVAGVVEKTLSSVVTAPALSWTLEGSVWGGINGYPRCGTFYEQRLWQAGSPGFPQTLWGSVIAEQFDYLLGVDDTDAISYKIAADQVNTIRHLATVRGLLALTVGGEFSVRGGVEKPITPTNVSIKDQSVLGCNGVQPIRNGNEVYFVQRANRKIRAMASDRFDADGYVAPDVSILSEHITQSGVTDMAYSAEPDPITYIMRADGVLATLTADRDQDVFAYARQVTSGLYQSVETIPVSDGFRVFVAVRRVVNGSLRTFIEMFTPGLQTDCALTGHSDVGATVWAGLSHLEGRTVTVKGDGVVLSSRVVTGGQIAVERTVFDIEIGLQYITRIETLRPEIASNGGTSQGSAISIHSVIVRLRDTIGCTINNQQVSFVSFGNDVLDRAPVPFSGDKDIGNSGWGDGQTLIEQRLPYPLHLLAVITKLTVNQG